MRVDYARSDGGRITRWIRHVFRQEKVVASLKTLAWVMPLTLLIWVYAEREQLAREPGVPIPINVTSGDPTKILTLVRPQERMILADLEGPRSELDAVRNEFARTGGIEALELLLDRLQLQPGHHELRTSSLVGSHSMFLERGITVANCQPATLTVFVDTYSERELPVQPPPSAANIVGEPVFEPPRVRVRAPADQLNRAEADGTLNMYADLASIPELAVPGPHVVSSVRVYSPGLDGQRVSYSPSTVKSVLEVRQREERYTLPFMAVSTIVPSGLQKQYRVEAPETIHDITLIGPPDKIALMRQENYEPRPYAALEVRGEDRPVPGQTIGPVRSRMLRFMDLPSGVRVSAEDAQRTVEFKLLERIAEQ
jgi:hypothetical protein